MEQIDAAAIFKQVASHVTSALSGVDVNSYGDKRQRAIIAALKRLIVDARLDIRDMDMSDTRLEMERHSRVARKRLAELHKNILAASDFDVFNAVDVAQLSAQIEQITAGISGEAS
jgi:hypothetical protein